MMLKVAAGAQVAPNKTWYAPGQAIMFSNAGNGAVELILTQFTGRRPERGPVRLEPGAEVDLHEALGPFEPGTYMLYPVKPGEGTAEYGSTPWVISVRVDTRAASDREVMVIKIEPLRYAVIETRLGEMAVAFYYDAAPHTVANFLTLAEGGYYDGLSFHRIVPGFVIQGGDPKGDSTGGPGYRIDAKFNNRPHLPGVLSMARSGDPLEAQGAVPRSDAANSAGSQFFIALDYENTRRLDGRYTVFGRVIAGMEVVKAIGAADIADEATGKPSEAQVIRKVRVEPVQPGDNPYATLFDVDRSLLEDSPGTRPSTQPMGNGQEGVRSRP